MFEPEVEYEAILSNISLEVRNILEKNYKKPFLNPFDGDKEIKGFGSKDIFYYIYAILYCNIIITSRIIYTIARSSFSIGYSIADAI